MRLSPKSLAFACGLLWGGAILFVGLINLASASYGMEFLKVASSIYPGFHASRVRTGGRCHCRFYIWMALQPLCAFGQSQGGRMKSDS